MKFEVGERVQFIYGNELKTGAITNLYIVDALVKFDSGDQKDACIPFAYMMKLDQPEPVEVPKFVDKIVTIYQDSDIANAENKYVLLGDILKDYFNGKLIHMGWQQVANWLNNSKNIDVLVDAVIDGYVVEEEKKYYVKLLPMEEGFLNLLTETETYDISSALERKGFKTKFTETEIKAIDEKLWALSVPVEEVEVSE